MTPQELIAWRKQRSLTRSKLADILQLRGVKTDKGQSVHEHTVKHWETGRSPIPDDLPLHLLEADKVVDNLAEEAATRITPAAFPHLFRFERDLGCFMMGPLHPNSLTRRGLLGWTGCIWHIAHFTQCADAPPELLKHPAYAEAVKAAHRGETHPGVQARKAWFSDQKLAEGMELSFVPNELSEIWPILTRTPAVEPWFGFNYVRFPDEDQHPDWFPDRFVMKVPYPNGFFHDDKDRMVHRRML